MEIYSLGLPEVKIIKPKKFGDHRGYFSETFNCDNLSKNDVNIDFVQDNQSHSVEKNILRGLHFQQPPYAQAKLMRVITGEVFDVAVDLRSDSVTFGKHVAVWLNGENKEMLYIPRGFAHGFVVMSEKAVFSYKVDSYYHPQSENSLIWDDMNLNINWPLDKNEIHLSKKDINGKSWKQISFFAKKVWEN